MTASEEVVGDQPNVDDIHIPPKRGGVLGCYEVDRGGLQLQRDQRMFDEKPETHLTVNVSYLWNLSLKLIIYPAFHDDIKQHLSSRCGNGK